MGRIRPVPVPTRLGTVVVVVAAVALLTLPACSKKKAAAKPTPTRITPAASPSPSPSPSPSQTPEAQANFIAQGVQPVDSEDRASAAPTANDVARKVIGIVNSYYNVAFIQSARWAGGSHPDLPGLFSDDARASVAPNLQVLALGSVAPQLRRVDPNLQNAGVVKVLIEHNGSASMAAVSTLFDGTGHRTGAGAPVVHIVHKAQFLIDTVAGKIVGYDMTNAVDSVAKSASYIPPGSQALSALGAA